eukprot:CAMPEP_0113526506 /NCGR_PEP_ID=MMETSP0015_2-20120614/779_1 /TAXON_ID=2838 /ORGANISM="Odontella" /LENGTH=439 /DNA_ID=CAMNT_0000424839 /DNA_START=194 /DNA_END=1509 /DNA_ORIENTATION=+ /assembly_acc=CAM_ASM_000160
MTEAAGGAKVSGGGVGGVGRSRRLIVAFVAAAASSLPSAVLIRSTIAVEGSAAFTTSAFLTSSRPSSSSSSSSSVVAPWRICGGGVFSTGAAASSSSSTSLGMAGKKSKKKAKKKGGGGGGGGSSGGIKGFGSAGSAVASSSSSSSGPVGEIDRSKPSMEFYSYLENQGAGSNLKRVALAHFPITDDGSVKIRGVMALRKIKKGEPIIDIPYELALNLGRESSDPTLPASVLLREYCAGCASPESDARGGRGPYLAMLPEYMGSDCRGSTDFFDDDALDALQSPLVKDETLRRRGMTERRYESEFSSSAESATGGDPSCAWSDGETVTQQHLLWASWLITSRVLTVQGAAGTDEAYRLMIPLVDMCNHDRSSPHVLTGRAAPGGSLKVAAGRTIEPGEQINICYGGGVAGNDRFVQDYGFLDNFDDGTAFDIVAKILAG